MPIVRNELEHTLGKAEAIRRLKDSCDYGHSISDLKETWLGDKMDFKVSIQGIKISGQAEVTDTLLKVEIKVPLIAIPFKSWIPNILKNALKPRISQNATHPTITGHPVVLYLHIPKAGGTTLGDYIYNQCKDDGASTEGLLQHGVFFSADGFFRDNEKGIPQQYKTMLNRNDLRAVIGHFAYGIHQFAERPFQYITMLRQPVPRVISLYQYLNLQHQMTLEQFANDCPYREIDNDQTRRISGINSEAGQCSAKDLETAKENLRNHFAVVGITERFDESLALIKLKLHWSKDVPSFPRNVNPEKKPIITESAMRALEKRNQYDMELYQYANQLMDEMIATQQPAFEVLLKQQKDLNTHRAL